MNPDTQNSTSPPSVRELTESYLERLLELHGNAEHADLYQSLLRSVTGLMSDEIPRGDLKLISSAVREMRRASRVFLPFESTRKVSVFGSARTRPGEVSWQQAHAFAEKIVKAGWMVITGAGDGIMGAAQGGAGRERSFGVNIRLPFEQSANKVIAGDHKLINFRYFFTRKVTFVKESHAICLFPGGFGTHDEGFESLTLIQTGKSELVPVVFVDDPGGSYWHDWQEYVRTHLLERKLISANDMNLFTVTDDVDRALAEILNFYSNYHSSRYVGPTLVLRVRKAPTAEQLDQLNVDFADILFSGRIETGGALPEENGAFTDLARVWLPFNRRDHGRLRDLINRLNSFVPERSSSPAQAEAHKILPDEGPVADGDDA